jgi:predicted ATPase/DNA-binding CsgD family transcriptional regulator
MLRVTAGDRLDQRSFGTLWMRVPGAATSLIGRQREIGRLRQLVAAHRLVTLTGPGGCGKTRLAMAAALDLDLEARSTPLAWVSLAPHSDPSLVVTVVAASLGLRDQPRTSELDAITGVLSPRPAHLVLDNCEHLVAACADLASILLDRCPQLRILATSREPLGLAAEHRWTVPALPVPDPHNVSGADGVLRYDSARLLLDRGATADPGFALTAENAGAVAAVCARLDGLPLAIELAAARMRWLSVEEIAAQLVGSFDVLTGGGRSLLPQQRTIRATLDWSYQLLPSDEAALLNDLSVFSGGFNAVAVQQVCGDPDSDRSGAGLRGRLERLVGRSLVQTIGAASAERFGLLENVRQYGAEQHSPARASELRRRHLRHYLDLVEELRRRMGGPERDVSLAALDADASNLRLALGWSAQHDLVCHVRLVSGLLYYWFILGHLREAVAWVEGAVVALDPTRSVPPAAEAELLSGAGLLAWSAGDTARAGRHLERSVALFRVSDDVGGLAQALRFLSGNEESLGNYERARTLVRESVELFRTADDRFGLAMSLARLGITAYTQGDDAAAEAALDESVAISRAAGDGWPLAMALRHQAIGSLRRGQLDRTDTALREALEVLRTRHDRFLSVQHLETMAELRVAQGRLRTGVLLFGALQGLRESLGVAVIYASDFEHWVMAAREALGAEFAPTLSRGRELGLEEAYAIALDEDSGPVPAKVPEPLRDESLRDGLTRRELDVLRLVAGGLTNNQAAAELVVSPRTVNWHLTSIYAKLGLRSRSEATRYAVERGLV